MIVVGDWWWSGCRAGGMTVMLAFGGSGGGVGVE